VELQMECRSVVVDHDLVVFFAFEPLPFGPGRWRLTFIDL
jgi:hypothetical protein